MMDGLMLWNLYSVEASIRKVSAGFSIIFSIFGVTREEDRREEDRTMLEESPVESKGKGSNGVVERTVQEMEGAVGAM